MRAVWITLLDDEGGIMGLASPLDNTGPLLNAATDTAETLLLPVPLVTVVPPRGAALPEV